MIKVPEKCLSCGSAWSGGAGRPNHELKEKARVFYECGANLSYMSEFEGCQLILFKGCTNEKTT